MGLSFQEPDTLDFLTNLIDALVPVWVIFYEQRIRSTLKERLRQT